MIYLSQYDIKYCLFICMIYSIVSISRSAIFNPIWDVRGIIISLHTYVELAGKLNIIRQNFVPIIQYSTYKSWLYSIMSKTLTYTFEFDKLLKFRFTNQFSLHKKFNNSNQKPLLENIVHIVRIKLLKLYYNISLH